MKIEFLAAGITPDVLRSKFIPFLCGTVCQQIGGMDRLIVGYSDVRFGR